MEDGSKPKLSPNRKSRIIGKEKENRQVDPIIVSKAVGPSRFKIIAKPGIETNGGEQLQAVNTTNRPIGTAEIEPIKKIKKGVTKMIQTTATKIIRLR